MPVSPRACFTTQHDTTAARNKPDRGTAATAAMAATTYLWMKHGLIQDHDNVTVSRSGAQ